MADTQTTAHPIHLAAEDFDPQLQAAGDKPVLVDFYAEWCGPCKMAAPIMEKLSGEYSDKAIIAKVDVDEEQDLASRFGIMSIPTVIVFKAGKEVARKIGFPGEPVYRQMLDTAVAA